MYGQLELVNPGNIHVRSTRTCKSRLCMYGQQELVNPGYIHVRSTRTCKSWQYTCTVN